MIYGEDRLLIVQSEEIDELKMLHPKLPVSYISQNWPVQHVAASQDGMYLAVDGLHGLIRVCYGWERLLLSATILIRPKCMNCSFTQDITLIKAHCSVENHC